MSDLVSIIMPAYNCEKTLEESINSVVMQNYPEWELLVVDDGSSDGTWQIIQRWAQKDKRIKPHRLHRNSGGASAPRNLALSFVQGGYVAFLDADDQWSPEKLEFQVRFMKDKQVEFSYHSYTRRNQRTGRATIICPPSTVRYQDLLYTNHIACLTVMLTKRIINNHRFDERVSLHEDYIMWLRLLRETKGVRFTERSLATYQVSEGSFSGNKWKAAGQQWRIYRDLEHLSFFHSLFFFVNYAVVGALKKYLPNLIGKSA